MYHAGSSHQSLRTSTVYIKTFSKEKARTFYMFPFHSFRYSFQCCLTKFCRYFLSTVSLFCLLLCWQTVNLSNRTGEDRRWQTLCHKRGNNLVWKEFLSTLTFLKYPASRKIEVTLLAGYPLNRSFWLKTRVWAILSTLAQMWRAKGDVNT